MTYIMTVFIPFYIFVFSIVFQDVFHTGNVIQLVSRVSNHALQIVMSPTKQLVVDGAGGQGPQFTNGK